jgi:hypothetical protein
MLWAAGKQSQCASSSLCCLVHAVADAEQELPAAGRCVAAAPADTIRYQVSFLGALLHLACLILIAAV